MYIRYMPRVIYLPRQLVVGLKNNNIIIIGDRFQSACLSRYSHSLQHTLIRGLGEVYK